MEIIISSSQLIIDCGDRQVQRWEKLKQIGNHGSDVAFLEHLLDDEEKCQKTNSEMTVHLETVKIEQLMTEPDFEVNLEESAATYIQENELIRELIPKKKRGRKKKILKDAPPPRPPKIKREIDILPLNHDSNSNFDLHIGDSSFKAVVDNIDSLIIDTRVARPVARLVNLVKNGRPGRKRRKPVKTVRPFLALHDNDDEFGGPPAKVVSGPSVKEPQIYVCEQCGFTAKTTQTLKNHQASHAKPEDGNEEVHLCNICGKCFGVQAKLRYHMRVHTKEKMYACEYCGKHFACKPNVQLHINKQHTGQNLFPCSYCGKQFVYKTHRDRHERIHTGEKLFDCRLCEKKFLDKRVFNKHMAVHNNDRPFQCMECPRRYVEKNHLDRHHREVHLMIRPYICKLCSKGCVSKSKLKRHYSQAHKVEYSMDEIAHMSGLPPMDGADTPPSTEDARPQFPSVL